MDLKQLETDYMLLKKEVETMKYHMSIMQMMLPDDSKYAFFHYVLTTNLSKVEVAKILKVLMKMNAKMKGQELPDELYTVGDEPVLFDTSLPMEQRGDEFVKYINMLFNGKVNPLYLLKAFQFSAKFQPLDTLTLAAQTL